MLILNTEILWIEDKGISYGASQQWYREFYKKKTGCGPTTASNQFIYLASVHEELKALYKESVSKENIVPFMDEVWKYVTPTPLGIYKTAMLEKGAVNFAKSRNITLNSHRLDIEKGKAKKQTIADIGDFIKSGIEKSLPIAFLNLSSGKVHNLDSWHWVLIVGFQESDKNLWVTIYDEGEEKEIDLSAWFKTSIMGGGFVYFEPAGR